MTFKIELISFAYKIVMTILNMENEVELYLMLFRRWLKQVKAHHDFNDNTFIITNFEEKIIMLTIIKCVNVNPLHQSKCLNDGYNCRKWFLKSR
jgi:hypothetical protein